MTKLSKFNAYEYLDTEESRIEYLKAFLEECPNDTLHAVQTVVKAYDYHKTMQAFEHVTRESHEVLQALAKC